MDHAGHASIQDTAAQRCRISPPHPADGPSRWKAFACAVIICVFMTPSFTSAVTPKPGTVKLSGDKTARKSATKQNKVTRVTGFVTKIGDGVIVVNKKSYSLSGVNVITKQDAASAPSKTKRQIAELIFLNGKLKEAVVHQ